MAMTMGEWQTWRQDFALSAKAFGRAVWLIDRNGEPYMELRGWVDHDFGDQAHDVAQGQVTVFADNPAVPWLLQQQDVMTPAWDAVLHEAVHMIVRTDDGLEWGYRVHELQVDLGGKHGGRVTLIGLRPLEHLKHLVLRSNTSSPDEFQLLWSDIRQGQSLKICKEYIHKALERAFQPLSLLGAWDLSQPSAWSGVDGSQWAIFMRPEVPDRTTEWTVIEARYDAAWDALMGTVEAAGLMVTAEYWFPGDPQPSPSYVTLAGPTIVMDVVDRAHHRGATGTINDPLRALRRMFSAAGENYLSDVIALETQGSVATAAGVEPWVVWKPGEYQAVSRLVITKSTDDRFVIGGKSPAALNAVLGTGIRALAAGIGSLLPGIGPALAVIIGDLGEEAIKDRILAFQTFDNLRRRTHHGRLRYREVPMTGEAWSISAVQQGVAAMEATGGSIGFDFAIIDDAPYKAGRDFDTGDQAGIQMLGMTVASYVDEIHLTATRGTLGATVGLGDPRTRESTGKMLTRTLGTISGVLSRVKTYAGDQ